MQNDLLSRAHYGDKLVTTPLRFSADIASEPNERLGRYFERLVGHALASLHPIRHHSRVQIIEDKQTLGELDVVFQLSDEDVTHHWELAIKYYLQVGEYFVGLKWRDRLDLKLRKLFEQQLRLSEHPVTRERLNALGYPQRIHSQAWVTGMLFYPWGAVPRFPSEVSADHARGAWSVGFPAPYRDEKTTWVQLPKLSWHVPFRSEKVDPVSGAEAACISEGQSGLMWARIERDNDVWVERERLCVVNHEWHLGHDSPRT